MFAVCVSSLEYAGGGLSYYSEICLIRHALWKEIIVGIHTGGINSFIYEEENWNENRGILSTLHC
jgi:hypothetical protein